MGRTVLFVCPHGAGKSRIAAAWFNAVAPSGWTATTAGLDPQRSVSMHAPRLLADTPAAEFLDRELPRALSAVPHVALVVAIDCPADAVADAVGWSLEHGEFDEAMGTEVRRRVLDLVASLPAGPVSSGWRSG